MMWLDWMLFGNGHGMKSPYFDDVFYYLVDTSDDRKRSSWPRGHLYTWSGWFGCQLRSCEWRKPAIGSKRRLFGHDFVPFRATRKWFRVEVTWYCSDLDRPETEDIAKLYQDLKNWDGIDHNKAREWGVP